MGHAGGRRDPSGGGSPIGRIYRETTPAMVARVAAHWRLLRICCARAEIRGWMTAERPSDLGWS
jgi:hypothetical protein